jgi:hypothetical protein
LVEAYDLFKAIYQERGYRAKDIPALILQKNLFGMEIDDRAAQLAAFALMMKARADDRRIFDSEAKPNILAFEDSQGMNANEIAYALNAPINKDDVPNEYLFEEIQEEKDGLFSKKPLAEKGHVSQGDIAALLELFENAKTFGSLIQVSPKLAAKLPGIEKRLDDVLKFGDLTHASAHVLKPLLQQARLLAREYDLVVANPPYMGNKYVNKSLKILLKDKFLGFEKDLFSASIRRFSDLVKTNGLEGYLTPFNWMFISTFVNMREWLIGSKALRSLVQLEINAFEPAMVTVCLFTCQKSSLADFRGSFVRLSEFRGADNQPIKTLEAIRNKKCGWFFESKQSDFTAIPGSPIAYWISQNAIAAFSKGKPLHEIAVPRAGMITGDNSRFVRLWHEVSVQKIGFNNRNRAEAQSSGMKWFPYQKGGEFRKWYGNYEFVVNWENDGWLLRTAQDAVGKIPAHAFNDDYIFKPNVNWSAVTSSRFSARITLGGCHFDAGGSAAFPASEDLFWLAGFLNSSVAAYLLNAINPTLNFQAWNIGNLPLPRSDNRSQIETAIQECRRLSEEDWNSHETSWDHVVPNLVRFKASTIRESQEISDTTHDARFTRLKELEEENNRLFIEAYGLHEEISVEVPDAQITLYRPDRREDIKRLLSYAIGCIMGRYSLDKPGLIYAHSGNQGFDASQYQTFRADDDGIIPLLETDWGIRDDATNRFVEFVAVAWPKEHLEENLRFVADSLGVTGSEQPRDSIRRYLATGFYKHHLSMYKRRPIYWLFSSGKQRAFQCLVYLHRYHEGTLARMRTEYVIPLQGQIAARMEQLEGDKAKATSTSHRKKLQKEQDDLKKQQAELLTFEEKLKHATDQKISLDLDDGVKVNYAKFGDLLAESKAITGGKEEE